MAINKTTKLNPETETDTIIAPAMTEVPKPAPERTAKAAQSELTSFNSSAGERAVQAVLPQLNLIRLSEVRRLHVTPPSLVSAGLVFASNFAEDRALFDGAFKKDGFDVAAYDNMRERAMAYWHMCILVRQKPEMSLKMLLAEAKPLRAKLVRAAIYLWGEDAKLGDIVADIRNGQAYLNQADDLGALARLFSDNWESAEGRCDVTREDVVNARILGEKFLEGVGRIKTEELTEQKELKMKTGEYLLRGVEGIRNAAVFVFGADEQMLSRYPALSVMRRRKAGTGAEDTDDLAEDVVDSDTVGAEVDSSEPDTAVQPVISPVQPVPTA